MISAFLARPTNIRQGLCLIRKRSFSTALSSSDDDALHVTGRGATLPPVPHGAHRIVLMRHGESEFNNANVFTGWCDVFLTPRGVVEAVEAGEVFRSHELTFRKCYTSLLTRSIVTAQRSLEAAGCAYVPLVYDWRINERHYGALQGLSKERTADRLGRALVMTWRRSFEARPPSMTTEHPHYDIIQQDPRYRNLAGPIPLGESLEDCQHRLIEVWKDIVEDFGQCREEEEPNYSLLVAHANSLRALVMHLDDIPSQEIEDLNIPTAIPFYYDIDKNTGKVVTKEKRNSFRGIYIADERKKRSFLERRRAANDPWVWALHDDQVAESMLLEEDNIDTSEVDEQREGLEGVEEEAKHNTEVFSSALQKGHHH